MTLCDIPNANIVCDKGYIRKWHLIKLISDIIIILVLIYFSLCAIVFHFMSL